MFYENVEYQVVSSKLNSEETGPFVTHGIRVVGVNDGKNSLIEEVLDISLVLDEVQKLAERLTKCIVSPKHFRDAVDDFLVDYY